MLLSDLAQPYARYLCAHLAQTDRQGTSGSSLFLDACRRFNRDEISESQLIEETVRRGFTNVIDAFPVVNQTAVPISFFVDERKARNGITLTDDLLRMTELQQFGNLPLEVEARWRLVETAWTLNISANLLVVQHDASGQLFVEVSSEVKRVDVTSARDALNGYQKGKCFYCFRDIRIDAGCDSIADVDHFFPHILKRSPVFNQVNIDGVWNLVLACPECNRGLNGKFARLPKIDPYLIRLHRRNEFLIQSHHPLRETLIQQIGNAENERIAFLGTVDRLAESCLIHRWETTTQGVVSF